MYNFLAKNKTFFVYLPLGLYWILIFILTSIPGRSLPSFGIGDKFKHLTAFFVLGLLLNLALHFQKKFDFVRKFYWQSALFIGVSYGLLDEFHQLIIPGRYFEWLDLIADIIGIIAGILSVQWVVIRDRGRAHQ